MNIETFTCHGGTPIPCSYTSLLLAGVAWNFFKNLHGPARSHNLSCMEQFNFPTSYEKPFGLELESNPSPLASQATALTTRSCLHMHSSLKTRSSKISLAYLGPFSVYCQPLRGRTRDSAARRLARVLPRDLGLAVDAIWRRESLFRFSPIHQS